MKIVYFILLSALSGYFEHIGDDDVGEIGWEGEEGDIQRKME